MLRAIPETIQGYHRFLHTHEPSGHGVLEPLVSFEKHEETGSQFITLYAIPSGFRLERVRTTAHFPHMKREAVFETNHSLADAVHRALLHLE